MTQQKEIERLEAAIARFKLWASWVPDKRNIRQANNKQRQIDRMDTIDRPVLERRKIALQLRPTTRGGQRVFSLRDGRRQFGEDTVLAGVDLEVVHGERLGVVGRNGAGKSVLLKTLVGEIQPTSGEVWVGPSIAVGYLAQEQDTLDPASTPLATVRRAVPVSEGDAVSLLMKFLFPYEQVRRANRLLSGGERTRLQLLLLMLARPNLLVLDEPTNHLDIDSVEVLETAIEEFAGTVVAISHDRYFLDRVADRIVEVDGGVRASDGGYSAWLERRAAATRLRRRCRRAAHATGSAPPSTLRRRSSGRCSASSRAGASRSTRHELHAALRRAELLLAAGGDPRRPLELYGRAVTALAEDLDDPPLRAELAAGLEALAARDRGAARRHRGPAAARAATTISPGSATPCHSSPSISPTRSDRRSSCSAGDGGRAHDLEVAADRAHPKLGDRRGRVGRRRVVETELGAHRAADRARVDVEALARLDPEVDVARDGLHPDAAAARRADLTSPETVFTASPAAASSTVRSPETRFAASTPPARRTRHVAGSGAELGLARHVARPHVAARGIDAERRCGVERDVARRGLDVDVAERARAPARSAESERRARSLPSGQRTWTPTFGPRPTRKPDLRFRSTTTSWPPPRSIISTRASAIACRVTSLSRKRHELDLDAGRVRRSRRRPRRR